MASEFELAERQEDGSTMRDHLKAFEKATGKAHPRLAAAPRLPKGCEQVLADFMDLHGCRTSTGFGPAPISYLELDAWQRVNGLRLEAWEIDAIRAADEAYMAYVAKGRAP
jgi:hypothetical protein